MAAAKPQRPLDDVATRFIAHRPKLFAIAHRSLGSPWAADDAVQESWLRLQRADVEAIGNLEAWLTTVVSRVCIDAIRRESRLQEGFDLEPTSELATTGTTAENNPESDATLSEDLGVALGAVLSRLGPLERLAFVLHDVFALSFEEIAPIVERTPASARKLASRARVRLREVRAEEIRERQENAIAAFLDAARAGDFGGLLQLLDPSIELRCDAAAVALAAAGKDAGAPLLGSGIRGPDAVSRVFAGRAALTQVITINDAPAAAYVVDGAVLAAFLVTFEGQRIAGIDVLADPEHLQALNATV